MKDNNMMHQGRVKEELQPNKEKEIGDLKL
jgi:hypothetical protein